MKVILKPLFELFTGRYALFDNVIYNYIAMAFVGWLAFKIAFNFVGDFYKLDIIESKEAGSLLHWSIRVVVFLVLFAFFSAMIWLAKLLMAIPFWVYIIMFVVFVLIIILIAYLKNRK